MSCYCGKEKEYAQCCALYITGAEIPATAEDLMRSRYSAFCVVDMNYLINTTDLQIRFEVNRDANENWAKTSKFNKLEILNTEESGNKSIVEFKAYFHTEGQDHIHHEISTFRKSGGVWFFRSARILPTTA